QRDVHRINIRVGELVVVRSVCPRNAQFPSGVPRKVQVPRRNPYNLGVLGALQRRNYVNSRNAGGSQHAPAHLLHRARGYPPARYPDQMPLFVFLPPQTDTTRQWAELLARDVPELDVVVAESTADAARELARADAAFGTLSPELLKHAQGLTWLQAPAIA